MKFVKEKIKSITFNDREAYRYGYYLNHSFIWHRENGPAIEIEDQHEEWYTHGVRHREDGMAYISKKYDTYLYYLNGIHIIPQPESLEEFLKVVKYSKF